MGCGRWSIWHFVGALFDDGMPVPKEPGVYEIRYAPGEKPKRIPRVFRPDPEGILCFGMTGGNLRDRLRAFYRAARGNAAAHAEGIRFHQLAYAQNGYPLEKLQVRWRTCNPADDADKQERELLNDYAERYGEAPPLNRQVPARH